MNTRNINVVGMQIVDAPELDPIDVFWADYGPGRGSVTITCYGNAWTCYFGAIGGNTIREFFAECEVNYLTDKLGISDVLKRGKREQKYLRQVIDAVRDSLR